MITPRVLYNQLERIKGKLAAGQEDKTKIERQLSKQIPLNRHDSRGRRYGLRDGIRRLEIAKNGINYADLVSAIMDLLPKTRRQKVEQLRRKLSKPYTYSTYSRTE